MKRIKKSQINWLIATLLIILSGLIFKNNQVVPKNEVNTNNNSAITSIPTPTVEGSNLYDVTKVIDGDTFDVLINNQVQRVRLIGVDTPEVVDPRKPVQCFGKEASNKTKEILTGKKIRLEADPTQGDKDKYGRILRYVFLEDGTNFNKLLISEGFAHEYTYNLPYKYRDEFLKAESEARLNKRGLWADNACPIPSLTPKPSLFPTRS